MDQQVFEKLREIIYRESGIVLDNQKKPLLANRLMKRLRSLDLDNEHDYLRIIELDVDGAELVNLIDAVSTNVTFFYREPTHFVTFANILKEREQQNAKEIKIWCAAASTGEEPYTLAITAAETIKRAKWKILATDICVPVLQKAQLGSYGNNEVEKVSPALRNKYFTSTHEEDEQRWCVNEELKEHVAFRRLNLVQFPYPLQGPIDIIFCRNVMIYFDRPTRQKIVNEFEKLLPPNGYLFVSHSESLLGIDSTLVKVDSSTYRKPVTKGS